jgi:hypothetical protein
LFSDLDFRSGIPDSLSFLFFCQSFFQPHSAGYERGAKNSWEVITPHNGRQPWAYQGSHMTARIGCPARSLAWDLGGAARCPELRGTTSWPTFSRVSEEKIGVKVIRHIKIESFPQGENGN